MKWEVLKRVEKLRFYDENMPLYKRQYHNIQVNDLVQVVLKNGRVVCGQVRELHDDYLLFVGMEERVFCWAVDEVLNVGREIEDAF